MTRTGAQTAVALAILPMIAITFWLALTGDHLEHPATAAVYWGYLVVAAMSIGLYWWRCRPASRFGPLLVVFGVLVWIVSWEGSAAPLVFNVGVLAEAPMWVLTMYLFLAFPMGRIEPRAARWMVSAMGFGVVAFFLPWALLSPVIAGGGPLSRCAGPCPENLLQVASAPTVAEWAGKLETYAALTLTAGVFVAYLGRLLTASRPQRRALRAVAVTSLLFLPAYFTFNFAAWILQVRDPETLDNLAWGIVVARVLLPLGFLIALLRAERFAATALRTLLERLADRPTREQWRRATAAALDDRRLQLGYHDRDAGGFWEPGGAELAPRPEPGRVWVPVGRDDRPVAAMVIDETLTGDPELVRAATTATLVAVENGVLEGELRASRVRILEAGHAERRRIERDLHDSAQQRLVSLRIRLGLVGEQLGEPHERALLERLESDVDDAIDDLRAVARGLHPQALVVGGPAAALADVARRSSIPVTVEAAGLSRHAEALETTVYFCCLECIQNAAKHAGPGASVRVRLGEADGVVRFTVADDGAGFDPATVPRGAGLTNLSDRLAVAGGTLRIESRPGHGTRITGELPA